MTKQETYITFILDELKKGNVQAEKVCSVFCSKFQTSARTFYNHWNKATTRYRDTQILLNKQKDDMDIAKELELKKSGLLSKEQRLKIADEIAKGTAKKIKIGEREEMLIPTSADQLKALDYLAKVHGDYAPTKQDLTVKEGSFKINIVKKSK